MGFGSRASPYTPALASIIISGQPSGDKCLGRDRGFIIPEITTGRIDGRPRSRRLASRLWGHN